MKHISLYNKDEIEKFLRRNSSLFLYHIGDLDEFYFPLTQWYGIKSDDDLKAVLLLYKAFQPMVIQALSPQKDLSFLIELLHSCLNVFPDKFYAHLTPGIEEILESKYKLISKGEHYKMILKDKQSLHKIDTKSTNKLFKRDIEEMNTLYSTAYPDNFFDPRMLETGMYFGIKNKNQLICVAGIHVYSKEFRVASLGNITTHPDYRNKGYGTAATAKLCIELLKNVDTVGLNVGTDNTSAVKSYEKIGFTITDLYREYIAVLN
jgi:RimJ/RimL family protein N-acetyltransferase